MKTTKSNQLHIKFSNHISPLTSIEMELISGGIQKYGNITEKIGTLIRRILFR